MLGHCQFVKLYCHLAITNLYAVTKIKYIILPFYYYGIVYTRQRQM